MSLGLTDKYTNETVKTTCPMTNVQKDEGTRKNKNNTPNESAMTISALMTGNWVMASKTFLDRLEDEKTPIAPNVPKVVEITDDTNASKMVFPKAAIIFSEAKSLT